MSDRTFLFKARCTTSPPLLTPSSHSPATVASPTQRKNPGCRMKRSGITSSSDRPSTRSGTRRWYTNADWHAIWVCSRREIEQRWEKRDWLWVEVKRRGLRSRGRYIRMPRSCSWMMCLQRLSESSFLEIWRWEQIIDVMIVSILPSGSLISAWRAILWRAGLWSWWWVFLGHSIQGPPLNIA